MTQSCDLVSPRPSYEEVISYYLRDDVSEFLWYLSQSRRLKFFHHSDTDIRGQTSAGSQALSLHCVATVAELCQRITTAASPVPEYPYPYFPFLGMQSTRVNAPGEADRVLGWDMRFEIDFDLKESFAVLLPVAAVLQEFEVPHLLKYSGHRSLHLIIPAEAFPLSMKEEADHKEWMDTMERIGQLFCRIAPYLIPTHVSISKELTLTAPYSFHRYHGLISLPLSLEQAIEFDPEAATLEMFPGTSWPFPDPWCDGVEMETLIDYAEKAGRNPSILIEMAERIFQGPVWEEFARQRTPIEIPNTSPVAFLMAGVVDMGIIKKYKPEVRWRMEAALLAMDDPESKSLKFFSLIEGVGFHLTLSQCIQQRKLKADLLGAWAVEGLDVAVDRIMAIASDAGFTSPVLLAVRLCSILPEATDSLIARLLEGWRENETVNDAGRLFLLIALGARSGGNDTVLNVLAGDVETPTTKRFKQTLFEAGAWEAEARPDLVLATLVLHFGEEAVQSWILAPTTKEAQRIIESLFAGKAKKFQYAAQSLGFGVLQ